MVFWAPGSQTGGPDPPVLEKEPRVFRCVLCCLCVDFLVRSGATQGIQRPRVAFFWPVVAQGWFVSSNQVFAGLAGFGGEGCSFSGTPGVGSLENPKLPTSGW